MLDQKTREEFIASLRLQATPLDFDQLIKDGILTRHSARWYQVLVSSEDLPEHVAKQADGIKSQGGKILIRLPKNWATAQKLYRELTGKSYDEE